MQFSRYDGDGEIRTHDPLLAGQVLSQLSYTPTSPRCSSATTCSARLTLQAYRVVFIAEHPEIFRSRLGGFFILNC